MLWMLANKKLIIYAVLAAGLVGGYFFVKISAYNDGVADTILGYEKAAVAEKTRVLDANQLALAKAQKRITLLNQLLQSRHETISALEKEASQDPNADRAAIGVDSVRRLNRIN
tara:strand:+ start:9727 stop:10068 length:342 start_codon:yes stop_codon:yes gene_type:complete